MYTTWVLVTLGMLVTAIRFNAKRRSPGKLGWDDYFDGFALVSTSRSVAVSTYIK